ncbi:MAG TPA: Zn-dependent alcohol dehydrogenase [Polyangia bacterium]|nr:Zn-dependent alcohol dehydrogenase [Polyangia bacterium]
MPRDSRAAVMRDFNTPLSIETVRLKEPRENQVVVRVVASGICHTDLSVLRANLPYPPPVVLGHEGAGVVEEIGRAVTTLAVGDHVVLSSIPHCGHCAYCRDGHQHLCESGLTAAMEGRQIAFERDGADIANFCGLGSFSRYTVVDANAAIKIDDDIPLARACLIGCGVVTGVGAALNTARVQAGDTVAVFGCGGVGVNVIQGAAIAGASRIVAVDVVGAKLEWARQFGATDALNVRGLTGDDASEQLRAMFGGRGVDFAFEAIGSPAVIRQAFLSVRRGGKAVIVGVAPFGVDLTLPACMIPLEERSLVGSLYGSAYMPRDVPKLLALYRRGKLKLDELVSREIKLDDINAAMEALEGGGVLRSVIVYE